MKNIKIRFNNVTLFLLLTSLLCGYIKYSLIILFIVIIHEIGHVFFILLFKYKIKEIVIYPFGGITIIDKPLNSSITKDLLISIGGICTQILLLLFIDKNNVFFHKSNISIILFNLIPIIPLDGSKFLQELLFIKYSYSKAININIVISIICLLIFIFFNYKYNLNNYLLISLFIYKIIESIKTRKLFYNKFILERYLNNIKFWKVSNNELIRNYKKDTKYYYIIDNKIIDDHEYLKRRIK